MKKYLIEDEEEIIQGNTPKEVIEDLRNGSLMGSQEPIEEYMKGFADRMEQWDGITIRSDSPENFFEDLLACGYIRQIP